MNPPEKIYLTKSKPELTLPNSTIACHEKCLPEWHVRIENDADIEYVRTDVFIKKACLWLRENKNKYLYNKRRFGECIPTCSDELVLRFFEYMKGE